jgi:hypothetical protein
VPTFLVTDKMHPALAARVQAAVSGHRGKTRDTRHPVLVVRWLAAHWATLARLGLVALVVYVVASVVQEHRRRRQETERARAALLDDLRMRANGATAADKAALPRLESWVTRLAGPYEGDVVIGDLRGPGALRASLARPLVYVHGSMAALADASAVADAASSSYKDALLGCLFDPPAARTEKALLARVRDAYRNGAAVEQATPRVRLLAEAEAGLPLLQPAWAQRVSEAVEAPDLEGLRKELRKAPIERAVEAAKAPLLLAVIDEPGTAGPIELDGERPHEVRLVLADMGTGTIWLRLRKHADPAWISTAHRSEYAAGLDGCAVAMDVVADLEARRADF